METIKNALGEQGSNSNFEKSRKELAKNFSTPKGSIPNWENIDIDDLAKIHVGTNKKIALKDVKEDDKGNKFIEINGRKYYEFDEKGTPKKSFYIYRGGSLFIGDKIGGMSVWDGVSFRCLSESMDNSFSLEQRKSRYHLGSKGGYVYLEQLIKSKNFKQDLNNSNPNNFDQIENFN